MNKKMFNFFKNVQINVKKNYKFYYGEEFNLYF